MIINKIIFVSSVFFAFLYLRYIDMIYNQGTVITDVPSFRLVQYFCGNR